MQKEHVEKLCEDYGLTADEFRAAAATQLLLSADTLKQGSNMALKGIIDKMYQLLSEDEMIGVIKWATWVKHARAEGLPGQDVAGLLEVRKAAA